MQQPSFIFEIIVLIISVIIHEVSHGFAADALGDPTARLKGRLTLNPLKHIDPVGSIIVPVLTFFSAHIIFGWAKPVPFNPYNLKNRRSGELLIALAGPASNLLLALIFGTFIRFGLFSAAFLVLCVYIVVINISLAVFNLIPLPPLDGSKIVFALFPNTPIWAHRRAQIERYSVLLVFFLVVFLWNLITPVVPAIFRLFTGVAF